MLTNKERIQKDIESLAKFNSTPGQGLTRLSFTKEDKDAREYIKIQLSNAGLKVYEDAAGTVVGRLEGTLKDAPIVMVGSHFDSVRCGGNFDGNTGVVAAMEVARVIKENNIKLKYPVEFIGMIEEEGSRFGGGLFASSAMAGLVTRDHLDEFKDNEGISMANAMASFGLDPNNIYDAFRKPEDIKAFLELHIEQGPILEKNNIDIGIVDYIVGITQIEVEIIGRPDHAGTTPMNMRCDALDAATKVISKISSYAKDAGEGTVATVGTLKLSPGSANIVPGNVLFTVDIRSKKDSLISNIVDRIKDELEKVSKTNDIKYNVIEKLNVNPTRLSKNILEIFKDKCENLNFSNQIMLSGAGHDAMVMAGLTEVGLLFVPSLNGRSHCPEEWTDYDKLQKGVEVILETIFDLAEIVEDIK